MPETVTPETASIDKACRCLREGGVVAFPTETFYGLGADPFSPAAMAALLELKGERRGKGMPILVPDERVLSRLVEIDATSRRLIHKFWPGPLTLVLPAKEAAQGVVHEGRVGVRMTRAPLAQALLKHWDGPLTGTSANPSGRPAATSAQQVRDYFGGRVLVIDGGATPGGMPSTVIRPTGGSFEVLRVGVLSVEDLRAALGGSVSEKDA